MRLAAYETESVEPLLRGSDRFTFHADVTQDRTRRVANSMGWGKVRGKEVSSRLPPAAITVTT
jgi:hypothetical protein